MKDFTYSLDPAVPSKLILSNAYTGSTEYLATGVKIDKNDDFYQTRFITIDSGELKLTNRDYAKGCFHGLLAYEDFNKGTAGGWSFSQQGVWQVVNQQLVQSSDDGPCLAMYGNTDWYDYRLYVDLKSSDNDFIGCAFRVQDENNYYCLVMDGPDPNRTTHYYKLYKYVNGEAIELASVPAVYQTGKTYKIKVILVGDQD